MEKPKVSVKSRENGLDLLRIISALAVILVHVNALYFADTAVNNRNLESTRYVVESIINIVTRFCVPSFVMISGAFILNNEKNEDWRYFYCKSIYKIFLPVVAASVGFLAFDEVISTAINKNGVIMPLKRVATGGFYNLWYMYMLFGLYMLTPFIIKLKKQLTYNEFRNVSIVLCFWAVISQAFSTQGTPYVMGVVFAYTSYYTLGSVLMTAKKNSSKKSHTTENFLLAAVAAAMYIITFIARYKGVSKYLFNAYINFFSPTIMIAAVCVFKLFLNLDVKKNFSKAAGYTFYVYLFHTIIYKILNSLLNKKFSINNELEKIGLLFVITTISAFIAAIVYKNIWDFLNKIGLEKKWFNMKIWKNKER